jgi:hypothetical protein
MIYCWKYDAVYLHVHTGFDFKFEKFVTFSRM